MDRVDGFYPYSRGFESYQGCLASGLNLRHSRWRIESGSIPVAFLMGFILLIVAAILYFAGPWFDGQDTVAIILAIAGVIAIVLQLVFFGAAASQVRKQHRNFDKRWNRF